MTGGPAVVGTAGADPEGLADAVGGSVGQSDADPVLIALDLSCDPGVEERELVDALADRGASTALVATRVDRYPDWPDLVARARGVLDPDRRLALFAVSADTGVGLDDLMQWCAAVEPGDSVPVRRPTAVVALAPAAEHRDTVPGPTRADRLSGVRAGVSAARGDVVTATREAFQHLAVTAERACGSVRRRDVGEYVQWLSDAVDGLDSAAQALLTDRLDRIRAVAALGRDEPADVSQPAPPAGRSVPPPPERRPTAEDTVVLLFGVTAGFGVGRVLVTPMAQLAGLGWFGAVVTAATGLAVAAWVVGVRRTTAARAALRRWTADTVTLSRTAAEHRLASRVNAVEVGFGRQSWNRTAGPRV